MESILYFIYTTSARRCSIKCFLIVAAAAAAAARPQNANNEKGVNINIGRAECIIFFVVRLLRRAVVEL